MPGGKVGQAADMVDNTAAAVEEMAGAASEKKKGVGIDRHTTHPLPFFIKLLEDAIAPLWFCLLFNVYADVQNRDDVVLPSLGARWKVCSVLEYFQASGALLFARRRPWDRAVCWLRGQQDLDGLVSRTARGSPLVARAGNVGTSAR